MQVLCIFSHKNSMASLFCKSKTIEEDITEQYSYSYNQKLGSMLLNLFGREELLDKQIGLATDFVNSLWLNRLISLKTYETLSVLHEYVKDLKGRPFLFLADEIVDFHKKWRNKVRWNEVGIALMHILLADSIWENQNFQSLEDITDWLDMYEIRSTVAYLRTVPFEILVSMLYMNSSLYFPMKEEASASNIIKWTLRKQLMEQITKTWKSEDAPKVLSGVDKITKGKNGRTLSCHIYGTDILITYLPDCCEAVGITYNTENTNKEYLPGSIGGFEFTSTGEIKAQQFCFRGCGYDNKDEILYSSVAKNLPGQVQFCLKSGQWIVCCPVDISYDFPGKIELIENAFELNGMPVKYIYQDYILIKGGA